MVSSFNKVGKIISILLILLATFLIIYGLTYVFKDTPKEDKNNNSNDNNNKQSTNNKVKYKVKENEVLFGEYVYTLPEGWSLNENSNKNVINIFTNTTVDGVTTNIGAIVSVEEIAKTGHTREEIFKDAKFFKSNFDKSGSSDVYGDGFVTPFGDSNVIVFPYINDKTTKLLLAYMPAYEGYFYDIQFFSNKLVDGKTETFYNFDDLDIIFNFLNTRKKVS